MLVQKEFNLTQIDEIATAILAQSKHKIIAFHGEMGVGKTTLIKVLAKQLGVHELTNSPTFSIVNEYRTPNDIVYHFDCYRIEDEVEAYDIGIEDYLYSDAWCFIEWPERIKNLLPNDITEVTIEKINEQLRSIRLKN
ncbi:tRNA (adenosine(37)-N6)-threonylcarbamoyltransferase complex ATPase subunit type 1 TsaE [Kordia sp.]|uniref:tRNA (adenosine(37)-N6)-threonylcarbamoyltransferase complex ATPase subunit type 1 TsaE n=1 Tax=Kordia sp. TaxID=1965332 RepID=UPI003D28CDCE